MNLGMIAGTISTTIFMLSQVPMLLKAIRTKNLESYSLINILMSTTGNLIHWCYISTLPLGPIWFLHSFSSVSASLMLIWYLRYQRNRTASQQFIDPGLFELDSTELNRNTRSGKEISEFHACFRPYVNAIFRGALILTDSTRSAEKLQVSIYLRAFMRYLQSDEITNFEAWLLEIVGDCFYEFRKGKPGSDKKDQIKRERAMHEITRRDDAPVPADAA